jgi:hypothetical protein
MPARLVDHRIALPRCRLQSPLTSKPYKTRFSRQPLVFSCNRSTSMSARTTRRIHWRGHSPAVRFNHGTRASLVPLTASAAQYRKCGSPRHNPLIICVQNVAKYASLIVPLSPSSRVTAVARKGPPSSSRWKGRSAVHSSKDGHHKTGSWIAAVGLNNLPT